MERGALPVSRLLGARFPARLSASGTARLSERGPSVRTGAERFNSPARFQRTSQRSGALPYGFDALSLVLSPFLCRRGRESAVADATDTPAGWSPSTEKKNAGAPKSAGGKERAQSPCPLRRWEHGRYFNARQAIFSRRLARRLFLTVGPSVPRDDQGDGQRAELPEDRQHERAADQGEEEGAEHRRE